MAGRKKKRNRTIVRFPGGMHLNIGIIVFLFIAFYMVYNIYSYLTAVHIKSYEVEKGTIEVNTSYTGLILRKETVVNAAQSGKLDYYLKDNTKASKGTLLCSVDENGNVSERLNDVVSSNAVLTRDSMSVPSATLQKVTRKALTIRPIALNQTLADSSWKLSIWAR